MKSETPLENLSNVENQPSPNYRINPYNNPIVGEKPKGKRLTVPDQSLTIKEILGRFTRGQRIPDTLVGYYDDQNDPLNLQGTNIETLDLSEKYDLLNKVRRQTSKLKARHRKQEQDAYEEKIRLATANKTVPSA